MSGSAWTNIEIVCDVKQAKDAAGETGSVDDCQQPIQ